MGSFSSLPFGRFNSPTFLLTAARVRSIHTQLMFNMLYELFLFITKVQEDRAATLKHWNDTWKDS